MKNDNKPEKTKRRPVHEEFAEKIIGSSTLAVEFTPPRVG